MTHLTQGIGCRADGGRRAGIQDEGRKRHHRHHARRREDFALRVSARRAGPVPDAVCGLALSVRDGRGAGLSAVSVARDRPGRMVRRSRATPTCTPTCAAPASPRASSSSWGSNEQQDYLELIAWIVKQPWCNGRVGGIGQSYYAMAQWLMATYNPPGLACIVPYDGLVDQYRGSNYHGGIYCSYRSVWYTTPARRQPASPRRQARPAADEVRSGRRDHQPPARRRVLARALAVLAARQDQVSGAVDRPLGQDGPASARQHPRLRGGQGAEEARRHRRAQHLRSAQDVRPGRIPREGTAAVLRPASQGQEQRLHGGRAGAALRARRQRLARRGGMAAEGAPTCRIICARGRRAASPR